MAFLGRAFLVSFLLALLAFVNLGFVIGAEVEAKQNYPSVECQEGVPFPGECYDNCYYYSRYCSYYIQFTCDCYFNECYLK
ncbi:hypothetical protein ZOSMA_67G00210 [Zostera marina]|uniref:Uncharacterized protein n=1 Tax=Zostera marina TaxID=29655 RepID=A0A0K9NRX3_ZOSMR|nr:hypothetical protein ZOSMA_67G00210 [Zostera marina]